MAALWREVSPLFSQRFSLEQALMLLFWVEGADTHDAPLLRISFLASSSTFQDSIRSAEPSSSLPQRPSPRILPLCTLLLPPLPCTFCAFVTARSLPTIRRRELGVRANERAVLQANRELREYYEGSRDL